MDRDSDLAMFELPNAKRCVQFVSPTFHKPWILTVISHGSVRREELYDSSSERNSSPDPEEEAIAAELRAKLNAQLSNLISLDLSMPLSAPHNEADINNTESHDRGEAAPAFEFRLFSSSAANTAAPPPKVVLLPDDEVEQPYTGPAISQRPPSYYLRGELPPQEREKLLLSSVTAEQVRAWASQRAWGLELPWRVTRITVGRKEAAAVMGAAAAAGILVPAPKGQEEDGDTEKRKKKTRPGKKTRIARRKREKARKAAQEALERQRLSKEEHLREKKKRLNREKKLKRRQKEREKKAAARAGAGTAQAAPESVATSKSDSEGSEVGE
jgi:hypothetical protein